MVRTVGSRSGARNVRVLSPAFIAKQWKRGQSGNPAGHAAEYGEVVRLAKSLSVRAIERLGELMESDDERVAAVACNMILDRAFGKALTQRLPVQDSLEERLRAMTPEQREAEAHALYDRAKARLLQDRREREDRGEIVDEAGYTVAPAGQAGGRDNAAR